MLEPPFIKRGLPPTMTCMPMWPLDTTPGPVLVAALRLIAHQSVAESAQRGPDADLPSLVLAAVACS
jgi:hypothetical protein